LIQPADGGVYLDRARSLELAVLEKIGLVAGAGGVTVAPIMKTLSAKARNSGLTINGIFKLPLHQSMV